jgi:superfamily II DNA/RNA helicase
MPSTGPDLTETTTAPWEPTDAEPPSAEHPAAERTAGEQIVAEPRFEEPVAADQVGARPEEASEVSSTAEHQSADDVQETPPDEDDRPDEDHLPRLMTPDASTPDPSRPDPSRLDPIAPDPVAPDPMPPASIPIAAGPPPEPVRPKLVNEELARPEAARVVFADLGLSPEVLHAIDDMGYRHPTPIQEQAIPYVLMGRDVMGTAQTGTGKTAGFTLPMLDILSGSRARARMPRSLILEPTRELALQVAENFVQYGKYLKLTHALIIGGESMSDQKDVLNRGVDVLIATPGRLLDMFERGTILLSDTKLLVIDEADRMLDMGFIPDVERIVAMLPSTRQTLFFSATMGPEIRRLVNAFLTNPKEIAVSRAASVATTITEGLALVAEHDKREALRRLIRSQNVQNALIFCNRKRDVDILHKSLTKHHFDAGALHGDMAQTVRFSTLEKFKANELRLLVCSDVAARGLDIGGLSHVFNFDVPIHAEDYVHRIGRTGRAGLEGRAFTIAAPEDRYAVEQIEKLIGHPIPPILVEGLDPVGWAEKDARKRRGRKSAEPKKPTDKVRAKEAEPADKPPVERKRAGRTRTQRARPDDTAQPELAVVAERAPRREEPLRDEPRRAEPRRAEPRHDEPRYAEPRHAEPRQAEPRYAEPRHAEPRRDEPRRDEFRRERYRRDDDLGPAVVGFGDDVPAFMFLRTRPPQSGDARQNAENREIDA